MPDKIGSSQGTVKLYDVNRSPSPKEGVAIVRYSPDGRSVSFAKPQIKRSVTCDPSIGFLQPDGLTCGNNGLDRVIACAKPVRLADSPCNAHIACMQSYAMTQTFSWNTWYSYNCDPAGWSQCTATQTWYTTHYFTAYRSVPKSSQWSHYRLSDGSTSSEIGTCNGGYTGNHPTSSDIAVQLSKTLDPDCCLTYYDPDCCSMLLTQSCCTTNDCISIDTWDAMGDSINDWCNYVPPTTQAPTLPPPTQAPTTQAPTTQAPTTQAPTTQQITTQRITNPPTTQGSTSTIPKPPTNSSRVVPLPSVSSATASKSLTPLPSIAASPNGTTPNESNPALGALGLLAIAPVGLGIVAAGVGAYGIYKYCYPDKVEPEEDIEEAQSPQEEQESAVVKTSFNEPEDELVDEYVETKPLPTPSSWFSLAWIGNWFTRTPAPEPANEIELQTKETV